MTRRIISLVLLLTGLISWAAPASAETVGYVTSTGLYIRREANTSSEALRCAEYGEKLTILKEQGDWYYVRYNSVVSGYVAKKYVSKTNPTSSGSSSASSSSSSSAAQENLPSKVSDLGKAPASSKRGDRGNDVIKLQQALKILGHYSGSCDGVFGEITETAVKKFQQSRGLSQDGVAGKVTIKLIFGEEAADAGKSTSTASSSTSSSSSGSSGSKSKTEKVDWFSGGNSIIPKGATFTIKDVRTGVTIKCKHLFGANHLDAEPLNKDETAKLKKVYGGEWSWDRRPVLISYGGRIIAGSMNGMPHGDQSITDNNFDGQFCIHMVGSKTHGSSKVDPDHQACINEAAKASW